MLGTMEVLEDLEPRNDAPAFNDTYMALPVEKVSVEALSLDLLAEELTVEVPLLGRLIVGVLISRELVRPELTMLERLLVKVTILETPFDVGVTVESVAAEMALGEELLVVGLRVDAEE